MKPTHVVVAGWGQITQPRHQAHDLKDPLGLMAEAARRSSDQTGSRGLLKHLGGIMVVRPLSRYYPDPAAQLAQALGASPRFRHVSGIGGNSPQTLINQAAGMIAGRELDSVLIAGAEAYVPREPKGPRAQNALFQGIPKDYSGDDLVGFTGLENRHGMEQPLHGFPLFETALWAASGLALKPYLQNIGRMWSAFSRTAASHPYAWTRAAKRPETIVTPGPDNRPVAFPYTKFMTSYVTVDQGAAVILMSEEAARRYSPGDRARVYFLGGGYAEDRQRFMVQKSDFTVSPPLKAAVAKALERACTVLEAVDCFDLYSCFPCAVFIAKKMIGISGDDPRPLTLTGGLGFFGGPGSNYNLHAVATLAEQIEAGKFTKGMVTALGWFMHKQAVGVYGSSPHGRDIGNDYHYDQADPLAGEEPVPIRDAFSGTGIIDTYTVIYAPDQAPSYGVIYGKTPDQERFVAKARDHPDLFAWLMEKNRIGQPVQVRFNASAKVNLAGL